MISHRGNINGRNPQWENDPYYIDKAIERGYGVEVDVWCKHNILWLGHDKPLYKIKIEWLIERVDKLWVHCKNVEAASFFFDYNLNNTYDKHIHYFCHETDTIGLTSKGYMLGYPGKQPIKDTIAMMPEIFNDDVSQCLGVCSDFIEKYKII